MERSRCKNCGSRSLVRDDVYGSLVCSECGTVVELVNLEAQLGGFTGHDGSYARYGTLVRVGTSGAGSALAYKEKKVFEAQKLIDDFMFKLGLSNKSNDVKDMIVRITEGEYGQGEWFSVLIGACACVVMRRNDQSLPVAEAASLVGCDVHELGRMINRVVDFLDLKGSEFPVYNIVTAFERAVREFSDFKGLSSEEAERLYKQGMFLIQCAVKWFLTTGRRPLPVVVAVLVFVAELNAIQVKIDDVAMKFHAKVATSKLRYKELLKALVEASQALPWGKDVNIKNIKKNAPFVIQYMEKKSMLGRRNPKGQGIDLEDVISECLRKDFLCEYYESIGNDSLYYDMEDRRNRSDAPVCNHMEISSECLSLLYTKFLEEMGHVESMENGNNADRNRMGIGLDACSEWWKGKSDLSKKLMLKQILDTDVGRDALPPSFIKGCIANQRRREKINAAKERISGVLHRTDSETSDGGERESVDAIDSTKKRRIRRSLAEDAAEENTRHGKKKKRNKVEDIDWEDFIIETLLLHQVKEEEIEKGHYNALMDLHVFNSGVL